MLSWSLSLSCSILSLGSLTLYPTPQALLVFSQRDGLAHLSKTASVVRRLAAAYNDCESSPVIAAYREALAGGGGDPVPSWSVPCLALLPLDLFSNVSQKNLYCPFRNFVWKSFFGLEYVQLSGEENANILAHGP